MNKLSVGFPRMHKEAAEVRDFMPRLMHRIAPWAREVVVEEGSGSGMGIPPERYIEGCDNVRFGSNQDCYDQDIVVQVRSPEDDEMARMQPGTLLCSMLHYPTHPDRLKLMLELGLCPISMDSVIDGDGKRLIEYLQGTSWNAVWAGFRALVKTFPALRDSTRRPLEAVVVGAGPVGRYAAEAATKYGDVVLHKELLALNVPGVIVHIVGRNITQSQTLLRDLLSRADVFVDATFRRDPTQHIFPNALIGALPAHAVIVDATADPYIEGETLQVKAVEGIPTGSLDEYEFPPDHPAFDAIPAGVSTTHRRMTVSCYSWPGIKPKACMRRYGRQMGMMLNVLLHTPYDELSLDSPRYFERALYRGTAKYYLTAVEALVPGDAATQLD